MNLHKRILLADDDTNIAWALGRVLTRAGFKVVTCGDGAEALELLKETTFDTLVTDIQMPNLGGLALLDWARDHHPRLRVVIITAYGSPTMKELSVRKGAVLYMEKPVDPSTLIDVLKSSARCDSFSGTVADIDLFDYIQLMLITRRQVVVEVLSAAGGNGLLYINNGDVLHAVCGELQGAEAFYACLEFNGGAFHTLHWQPPPTTTIGTRGEHLLMKAARHKDERGRSDDSPEQDDLNLSGLDNLWNEESGQDDALKDSEQ